MTKRKQNKEPLKPKGKKKVLPDAPHRLTRVEYISNRSNYDASFHPDSFTQFCREGRTRAYVCAAWGISERTLSAWFAGYPAMSEARDIGYQAFKAHYEEIAYESLTFPKLYSASMLQFYLKNKCGWTEEGGLTDYSDVDLGVELDIVAV